MKFPYILFDTETTGLDSSVHGIVEIAARDSLGREFHENVIPWNECVYDPRAMEINGFNALLLSAQEPNELEVATKLKQFLGGAPSNYVFVGANPNFDFLFLQALGKRAGVDFNFRHLKMDIQAMAFVLWTRGLLDLPAINGVPSVRVDALLESFRSKRAGVHSALEDVRLEEKILRWLTHYE